MDQEKVSLLNDYNSGKITQEQFLARLQLAKDKPFGLSISEKTGKMIVQGLRAGGRPLELKEEEWVGLMEHKDEIEAFMQENEGKFKPAPKPAVPAEPETAAS